MTMAYEYDGAIYCRYCTEDRFGREAIRDDVQRGALRDTHGGEIFRIDVEFSRHEGIEWCESSDDATLSCSNCGSVIDECDLHGIDPCSACDCRCDDCECETRTCRDCSCRNCDLGEDANEPADGCRCASCEATITWKPGDEEGGA